jgi:Uma2 family endonuclease
MAVLLIRRRFTVDEYYRMAEAGILTEADRVELIEGEIVEMTPIGRRHAVCVDSIAELFIRIFVDVARTRIQNPIRLNEHNEPQPDVSLLLRRPDLYTSGHPTPEDVFLVVEVADTSLVMDRRVKMPLYARSGIPEAWLVDLEAEAIFVHRDPGPDGYRTVQAVRRGETLAPLAFPDRPLAAADILGAS